MSKIVRFLSITLLLTLALGLFVSSNAAATPKDGKLRLFVEYAPGQRGSVQRALQANGATFHYAFDDLNTFAVSIPAAAYQGISRNPNVVFIEEDVLRFPVEVRPSSAVFAPLAAGSQVVPYGVDMVQARDVWDVDRDDVVDTGAPTGANRTVCIIDSGFYTGHEDLGSTNVSGYNGNLPWNVDGSGHGSHVAGTVRALNNSLGVVGVTPGTVNVYVVRVFGDDGLWAYSSTLIDAANRCASAGANIISMSLSGDRSVRTELRGFNNLYSQGILSIAAASNDGVANYAYPASYDSVVSVGALDSTMTWADFSNFNDQVELSAPGVGVLSTVPYIENNSLTVGGTTYSANHIEFSARGTASGALVDGGLCTSAGTWAGKVVLCQRGDISFYDKVMNVQNGGGAAAVIYNNVPGSFLGTLGEGSSSTIIGISLSQEDGLALVAGSLGQTADVTSLSQYPASGYELYDGTSMATPHVSAVAALVWSSKPTATNAEVRAALQSSAMDLGTAGRDVYYGYGLVQAKAAIEALGGGGGGEDIPMSVADLDATAKSKGKNWTATVTITVKDVNGTPVSGVSVEGIFDSSAVSCTTGSTGQCSLSKTLSTSVSSTTFSVTNLSASGYVYNAAGNSDPDGDSNGTTITVNK